MGRAARRVPIKAHGVTAASLMTPRGFERRAAPYIFIAPFYILFLVFSLGPMIYALYLSFFRWAGTGTMDYIGFANYGNLLQDPVFLKAIMNTTVYAIGAFVVILPFALFLALLVNSAVIRLKALFRVSFFLPILASTVASTLMFLMLYNTQFGLFNQVFEQLGLPRQEWLSERNVKAAVLLVAAWRYTGLNMLYFLTGLQTIPEELYEAAQVDGAGMRAQFWNITLPMLRPVMIFVGIVTVIGSLQLFAEPLLLANGGPNNASLTIANYLYRSGFTYQKLGYAAAIGYVLALLIFVLALIQLRFFGAFRKED